MDYAELGSPHKMILRFIYSKMFSTVYSIVLNIPEAIRKVFLRD